MTLDSKQSLTQALRSHATRRLTRISVLVALTTAALGCRGTDAVVANMDGSKLLWSVTNTVGAVTMDTGTTFQLVLTPRYASGDVVPNLSPTSFTTNGPTKVTVSPTGLLTALEATDAPVLIVGTYTLDGVSITDTVSVAVTAGRHSIKTFSLQDTPTSIAINDYPYVQATVTDSSDQMLYDVPVAYTSSNPTVADFQYGSLTLMTRGTTTLHAVATVYGVTYQDSVTVTITNPTSVQFTLYGAEWQSEFGYPGVGPVRGVIGVGGTVSFFGFGLDGPSSITFITGGDSLPANANVPVFTSSATVGPFLVPGSYLFKIASGDTARVYVLP